MTEMDRKVSSYNRFGYNYASNTSYKHTHHENLATSSISHERNIDHYQSSYRSETKGGRYNGIPSESMISPSSSSHKYGSLATREGSICSGDNSLASHDNNRKQIDTVDSKVNYSSVYSDSISSQKYGSVTKSEERNSSNDISSISIGSSSDGRRVGYHSREDDDKYERISSEPALSSSAVSQGNDALRRELNLSPRDESKGYDKYAVCLSEYFKHKSEFKDPFEYIEYLEGKRKNENKMTVSFTGDNKDEHSLHSHGHSQSELSISSKETYTNRINVEKRSNLYTHSTKHMTIKDVQKSEETNATLTSSNSLNKEEDVYKGGHSYHINDRVADTRINSTLVSKEKHYTDNRHVHENKLSDSKIESVREQERRGNESSITHKRLIHSIEEEKRDVSQKEDSKFSSDHKHRIIEVERKSDIHKDRVKNLYKNRYENKRNETKDECKENRETVTREIDTIKTYKRQDSSSESESEFISVHHSRRVKADGYDDDKRKGRSYQKRGEKRGENGEVTTRGKYEYQETGKNAKISDKSYNYSYQKEVRFDDGEISRKEIGVQTLDATENMADDHKKDVYGRMVKVTEIDGMRKNEDRNDGVEETDGSRSVTFTSRSTEINETSKDVLVHNMKKESHITDHKIFEEASDSYEETRLVGPGSPRKKDTNLGFVSLTNANEYDDLYNSTQVHHKHTEVTKRASSRKSDEENTVESSRNEQRYAIKRSEATDEKVSSTKRRGKIPKSYLSGKQSDDTPKQRITRRKTSNPNLILGRSEVVRPKMPPRSKSSDLMYKRNKIPMVERSRSFVDESRFQGSAINETSEKITSNSTVTVEKIENENTVSCDHSRSQSSDYRMNPRDKNRYVQVIEDLRHEKNTGDNENGSDFKKIAVADNADRKERSNKVKHSRGVRAGKNTADSHKQMERKSETTSVNRIETKKKVSAKSSQMEEEHAGKTKQLRQRDYEHKHSSMVKNQPTKQPRSVDSQTDRRMHQHNQRNHHLLSTKSQNQTTANSQHRQVESVSSSTHSKKSSMQSSSDHRGISKHVHYKQISNERKDLENASNTTNKGSNNEIQQNTKMSTSQHLKNWVQSEKGKTELSERDFSRTTEMHAGMENSFGAMEFTKNAQSTSRITNEKKTSNVSSERVTSNVNTGAMKRGNRSHRRSLSQPDIASASMLKQNLCEECLENESGNENESGRRRIKSESNDWDQPSFTNERDSHDGGDTVHYSVYTRCIQPQCSNWIEAVNRSGVADVYVHRNHKYDCVSQSRVCQPGDEEITLRKRVAKS